MSKKTTKLFVSGDSFTAPGLLSKSYPDWAATTNWPKEFAKLIPGEVDLYNPAYRGHNNEYIIKTFFEYIGKYGNPDMVVIMWSCSGRMMMANELNKNDKQSRPNHQRAFVFDPIGMQQVLQFPNPKKPTIKTLTNQALNNFTTWYYNQYYPAGYYTYAIDNFYTNVFIIQEYCKAHDIPYLFSQAVDVAMIVNSRQRDRAAAGEYFISHYLEPEIDDEKFMGWPLYSEIGGFVWADITKRTKYAVGDLDSHPNDLGYKMIADKLWKRWNELYK